MNYETLREAAWMNSYLHENGICEKYWEEFHAGRAIMDAGGVRSESRYPVCIFSSFMWSSTIDGSTFWSDHHIRFQHKYYK